MELFGWDSDKNHRLKRECGAVEDYVYLVPFVESDDEVFLKTIVPSRKATKRYIGS